MSTGEPFLKVRFDGDAIGQAKIPVAHLQRFLETLTKALQRTGRVLEGHSDSVRRGQPPRSIKEEVALDLVLLTQGSRAAVLGFERHRAQTFMPQQDPGLNFIERAIEGLSVVQGTARSLPAGYDVGVLMAWRDLGALFAQGVKKIEFTLNHRRTPIKAEFSPVGFARLQERIKGPQTNIRTVEGRLLMADFKEHGTRCRIHPSAGEPILCLFDESQKDEVLEDILRYVRIVGEAKEDSTSGRITSIKIHDIERLEDRENQATDLLPQGTPISRSFWESPTLDELAASQGVNPMHDVRALFGTWPGADDDGFEEAIDELRHAATDGGHRR